MWYTGMLTDVFLEPIQADSEEEAEEKIRELIRSGQIEPTIILWEK